MFAWNSMQLLSDYKSKTITEIQIISNLVFIQIISKFLIKNRLKWKQSKAPKSWKRWLPLWGLADRSWRPNVAERVPQRVGRSRREERRGREERARSPKAREGQRNPSPVPPLPRPEEWLSFEYISSKLSLFCNLWKKFE